MEQIKAAWAYLENLPKSAWQATAFVLALLVLALAVL